MVLFNGVRLQIADVDPKVVPEGDSPYATVFNYYQGHNPSNWRTNVRTFRAVRLTNIYPGASAVFTTTSLSLDPATSSLGKIIVTVQPGADLDRFRLRVLNTGAIPFQGPGGIWFTFGSIRGVFIVNVQTTQIDGGKRVAIDSHLSIESADTLSVQAPGRNPALPTEVTITFPSYETGGPAFRPEKAADGNRYLASTVVTPTDFGEDGKLDTPVCNGGCRDAILERTDDSGKSIWVSLFGGERAESTNTAAASSNGVVVFGLTESQDFPVTSNAPQSTLRSPRDAFLAFFDRDTGQLRNATYAGLEGAAEVSSYAVDSGGDLAIGGGYSTIASTMIDAGYLLRWRPSENRFLFSKSLDAPVETLLFDVNSNLYFASTNTFLPTPRLQTGVVDASGQQQGSLVTIDAPNRFGDALAEVFGIRLLPGIDWEIWVAYHVRPGQTFTASPTLALARVSTTRGQVIFNRSITVGIASGLAFTPAGNIKVLVQNPSSTEITSPDAPLAAGCEGTPYFLILSPSGQTIYSAYVPATFDFVAQDDMHPAAPASLSCFASTAGRVPTSYAAPGQLITITGGGFGPSSTIYSSPDDSGTFPLTVGGFRVRIAGIDAHIIAVSRGLIAAQVPFEIAPSIPSASIEVFDNEVPLNPLPFSYAGHSFTFFDTGNRNNSLNLPALAALNEDGTVNSESNPANSDSIVSLFGSGLGLLSPPLPSGGLNPIPPAGPLSQSTLFTLCLGCEVLYLGSAPGLSTSVVQVNVRLTTNITGNPHAIGLALGASSIQVFPKLTGIVFVK